MTVDILFPFYGDVAMMKEAVRSVLRQTNPDWRLIVVDDGYPDDSIPGWFDSLKDSRVTYMRNETNLGANGNYRKCLTFVENPLVQVMGADDVMLPNYVDWLVKAAKRHPDANIFQPGVFVIDEHGAPSHTLVEKVKGFYMPSRRSRRFCAARLSRSRSCGATGSTSRHWHGVRRRSSGSASERAMTWSRTWLSCAMSP